MSEQTKIEDERTRFRLFDVLARLVGKQVLEHTTDDDIARAAIDRLTWIPVGDRLPAPGERCVLTYRGRAWPPYRKLEDVEDVLRSVAQGHPEYQITHWMPCPAPPSA